jgi:hypothetical protein
MWACALIPRSAAMAARSIMREKRAPIAARRVPRQTRTVIAHFPADGGGACASRARSEMRGRRAVLVGLTERCRAITLTDGDGFGIVRGASVRSDTVPYRSRSPAANRRYRRLLRSRPQTSGDRHPRSSIRGRRSCRHSEIDRSAFCFDRLSLWRNHASRRLLRAYSPTDL